ncbi:MAG TPA: carboxylesterase family protein [Thermoanaerobaculia bacterium]|jgi:carboxylesterase type B|nr:carboxylesterase family protein [Thermoanaerobaculia bacterium]
MIAYGKISKIAALLLGAAALAAPAAWAEKPACTTDPVTLSHPAGSVCGIKRTAPGAEGQVSAYLGIPFAKPVPRWTNPQELDSPWNGSEAYHATEFGPICPQPHPRQNPPATPCATGSSCGTEQQTYPVPDLPQDEHNCLNLNVFVPPGTAATASLPVMEFIYGGAFLDGSNALPYYDGTYLAAKHQAIIVVINYRLGILGGLFMEGITTTTNNNFGFRDQMLAMDWVHKNIAGFGGNPENITLFGESAGAMSIGLHALSTTPSHGTFAKAIMQSNELGLPYKDVAVALSVGKRIAEHVLGTETHPCEKDCMEGKTVADLVAAQSSLDLSEWAGLNLGLEGLTLWSPVVDETLDLKSQPVVASIDKPLILGSLKDEGPIFADVAARALKLPFGAVKYLGLIDTLFGPGTGVLRLPQKYKCLTADCTAKLAAVFNDFLFTCPNRYYAGRAAHPENTYAYFITQVPDFACYSPVACICGGKACHGTEVPFNFHTPAAVKPGYAFSLEDEDLSTRMQDFWFNFASTGNPNASGANPWPAFGSDKFYRILNAKNPPADLNPKSPYTGVTGLGDANCTFWDTFYSAPEQEAMLQRMKQNLAHPNKAKGAKKAPSAKKTPGAKTQ